MSKQEISMLDLEQQITEVKTDALTEEQKNADDIFAYFDSRLSTSKLQTPYPQTTSYTAHRDYEDHTSIFYEKARNAPYLKEQKMLESYCNSTKLYIAHLKTTNTDYFFMDDAKLDTKIFNINNVDVWFINTDDKKYNHITNILRHPKDDKDVQYARNIIMRMRNISAVDVIYDKDHELFSNITDSYLRNALIRNKNQTGVQSIIQTIQEKQDAIRILSKEKSIIVQGCAGSGKTMVLLHRLRYLIYNEEISDSDYILLVPGNDFKNFISSISSKFNINKNNIVPYKEYYQQLLEKKNAISEDTNELIFSEDFLCRIYSKKFLQECYEELFSNFTLQSNTLISFCDEKLNKLIKSEQTKIDIQITSLQNNAISVAKKLTEGISNISLSQINRYSDLASLYSKIYTIYKINQNQNKRQKATDLAISKNDIRITSNPQLMQIQNEITLESDAISKSSIFTIDAHKKKLTYLQKKYDSTCADLIDKLTEEQRNIEYNSNEIQNGINHIYLELIIITLKKLIIETNVKISELLRIRSNITETISQKHKNQIAQLNTFIEVSTHLNSKSENFINSLSPAYDTFVDVTTMGHELLDSFNKILITNTSPKEKEQVKKQALNFFSQRTNNQLYSYVNTILFNICKRRIKEEFDIKICNLYKHYWYLSLYCSYLTKPMSNHKSKYIFSDEAQDISASEWELIYKVNLDVTHKKSPIMNLFGDTHQVISSHGIVDWSTLSFAGRIYELNENFRNTNQTVDYCNRKLQTNMSMVGVNMDEVREYYSLSKAKRKSRTINRNAIFIVKDEYSKSDLEFHLKNTQIKDFQIFTVKQVKGLEFREVFVFETGMTSNEKYIAFTRALSSLNVIKSLPPVVDRSVSLIVQGDEADSTEKVDESTAEQ